MGHGLPTFCQSFEKVEFLQGEEVSHMPSLQTGGHLALNLSGMGGPTSSKAAIGIAFEFTSACRQC